MEALILFIGAIAAFVGLTAAASIWHGFVLTKLWLWFVVPQFHLAPLPIAVAIGLSLVVGMFKHAGDKDEKGKTALVRIFAAPAVALLFAWIVTLFIA